MKKLIVLLLAWVVGLLGWASTISEDFETTLVGGIPEGWGSWPISNSAVGIVNGIGADSSTNSVQLYGTSADDVPTLERKFALTTDGTLSMEWYGRASQSDSDAHYVTFQTAGGLDLLGIRFDNNAVFAYMDAGGAWIDTATGWAVDTWYKLRIDIDFDADTWSLSVNDTVVVSGLSFKTGVTSEAASVVFTGAVYLKKEFGVSSYVDQWALSSSAGWSLEDDFEGLEAGTISAGWSRAPLTDAVVGVVDSLGADGSSQSVRMFGRSLQTTPALSKGLAEVAVAGVLTVEWYGYVNQVATDGQYARLRDSSGVDLLGVRFDNNMVFSCTDAGGNYIDNAIAWDQDAWYKCRIEVDFDAETWSFFVNDLVAASNLVFRTDAEKSVASVLFTGAAYLKKSFGVESYVDQVQISSGSAYSAWAAQYGLAGGPDADDDGDALSNLAEFGLGGDPTDAADQGYNPTLAFGSVDGSNRVEYVYVRQTDASSGLTYYLEVADDLIAGNWTNAGYTVIGSGPFTNGFETVTNRVNTDLSSQQFIRLIIEGQ